ncbi:MAG TPA: hypothetical protein PK950_00995 [Candidatus Paceibacterota bacterium]|nr:hypothetical protein [Candidatus Paceibacterota bacterium]
MTPSDLSPAKRRAYDALDSETDKEEFLNDEAAIRKQAIRGAIAQVMSRNQSHNAGKHLVNAQKK